MQRIALSLQESLGEDNTLQMISVIAALAEKPIFPLLPLQRAKFIRYLVNNAQTEVEKIIKRLILSCDVINRCRIVKRKTTT